jgi:hypothetical protein
MKKIMAEIRALERKLAETGPRGGKIIGKTKSGKPIYDSHDHPAHAGYSKQDHKDAADAHSQAGEHAAEGANSMVGPDGGTHFDDDAVHSKVKHHGEQMNKHLEKAGLPKVDHDWADEE